MLRWRKKMFGAYRRTMTNCQRAITQVRRFGLSVSEKDRGLFPKARRSWKGPTRFYPRCPEGHPVDYDMARCFKCDPLPKLSRNKTLRTAKPQAEA